MEALDGLGLLFSAPHLIALITGVLLGFVVGALPGFDPATTSAIALPFTLTLEPEVGLIFMASIYAGSGFAAAIPSILLNVPGTPGAAATALDGHPMARAGRGGEAIGIARMASSLGGVIAVIVLLPLMPKLGDWALLVKTPETFLIVAMGLLAVGAIISGDKLRGLISAGVGVLIALMSSSPTTGEPRFTMGFVDLYGEVPFVPVIIGMFALSEMWLLAASGNKIAGGSNARFSMRTEVADAVAGAKSTLRHMGTVIRSSFIGIWIGIIPGMGTGTSTFVSYGITKQRLSKKGGIPFGKGRPEGVVAAETADNATAVGALIPTFTLGIPGSGVAAVMLAALYVHGLQPGPQLMRDFDTEIYSIMWAIGIASILILPIGVLVAAPLNAIPRLDPAQLAAGITVVALIGLYATRYSMFDIWLALVFGAVAIAMKKAGFPIVPVLLGLVLGPLAEQTFQRSLLLSGGSYGVFWESMVSKVLLSLIVLVVGSAIVASVRTAMRARGRTRSADGGFEVEVDHKVEARDG